MKISRMFVAAIAAFGFVSTTSAKDKAPSQDIVFLDQFSEHHSDAIKMGEMAVSKADSPKVKQMAEKMVSDQRKETAQMKKWREEIDPAASKSKLEMPKMSMDSLKGKSGRDFDIAFLEMMAKHHSQGVEMAKSAAGKVSNSQVKKFAQSAADKQDHERQQLEEMKKSESKTE